MAEGACPTPGKRRYPDEFTAIRATIGASRTYGKPMRAYRCPCGAWHVTSRTRRAV